MTRHIYFNRLWPTCLLLPGLSLPWFPLVSEVLGRCQELASCPGHIRCCSVPQTHPGQNWMLSCRGVAMYQARWSDSTWQCCVQVAKDRCCPYLIIFYCSLPTLNISQPWHVPCLRLATGVKTREKGKSRQICRPEFHLDDLFVTWRPQPVIIPAACKISPGPWAI